MPTRKTTTPVFSALTDRECRELLSRNHVGRLAFVNAGRVDIEPVSYVAAAPWIFLRSAHGSKANALAHTPYVAFEVDEAKSAFDWRSVVVRGTIYLLADAGSDVDRASYDKAVEALRLVQRRAFRDGDPTPSRDTVYGLHIDLLTGRSAGR
jgi:nitroimidazol reductase NimA-like FMN-containing flavoprotein (pyridoxamine 5'-phosphate oxidase superfamily)